MSHVTCPRCGSGELVDGSLLSTGTLRFRVLEAKFLTFHTADVDLCGSMCANCGAVTLTGNVEKLKLLMDSQEHPTAVP